MNEVISPAMPSKGKKVLAYVVTEDWYFLLHRLPMARAAKRAGYDVHVITHVNKGAAAIEGEGFHLHPLAWRRGSLNPFYFLSNIIALRRIYRMIAPAIVHHVALQPTIVGSLAAIGHPFMRLNAFTGLGVVFSSKAAKARLLRPLLRILLSIVLKRPLAAVLVENPDDGATLQTLGISADKITIISSGVETDRFMPLPEPDGPIVVGFVGRLLDNKGIRALVQAHDILTQRGAPIRLLIAGDSDLANPTSIPSREVSSWATRPGVEVLGHVADIRMVWKRAHIAVLPSRGGEGLPVSLLEAAACGRPIVATNVPGCREIARAGVNALLVPPDDPAALADAIVRLAQDKGQRLRFGAAGRQLVEQEFSAAKIGEQIVALYNHLLLNTPLQLKLAAVKETAG